MKLASIMLLFALGISLSSCTPNIGRKNTDNDKNTPAPLQESQATDYSSTKRYVGDLLEDIYTDQVKKRPDLQKLENDIQTYNDKEPDSLQRLDRYLLKSGKYYASANERVSVISDSTLKRALLKAIVASNNRYANLIKADSVKLKSLQHMDQQLKDYHVALKLMVSLPVMEQYQQKNKPDTKTLDDLTKEKQKLIEQTQKTAKLN